MKGYWIFIILIATVLILTSIDKTKNLLKNYISEFLTTIATIGLAFIGILANSDKLFIYDYTWKDSWPYLLSVFSIIMLISVIISARANLSGKTLKTEIEKNRSLEKQIEITKEEYYKLCSSNILTLFPEFYTTGSDRISIYKFNNNNHFILLGRCSKNANYNKRTNYEYSHNEGLLGKGWENDNALITGAPRWSNKNKKAYNDFMKQQCNINDKRLNKIIMKSQSLYAKTIHDNSTAEDPDGIIVFESINPTKVNKNECDNLINSKKPELLLLLKNMKSLTKKI
jgi:hypothetical protein